MLDRWHKKEKPHFTGYWFGFGGNLDSGPGGIQASGGTKTFSGIYTIHTFTSPDDFIVTSGGEVEYLIVGGGGGGGCGDAPPDADAEGGGGGAGAVYSTDPAIPEPQRKSPITVTAQTYPIVIGYGGTGAPGENNGNDLGLNGGVSSALGVTVGGGGGGGSRNAGYPPGPIPSNNNAGVPGPVASGTAPTDNAGSGGGGGQADDSYGPPGESTAGPLGKAGGHGHFNSTPTATGGGGGGGFTAAGSPSTGDPAYGGAGGAGITLTIPGSPLAVGGGGGGAGVRSLTFPQAYGSAGGLGGGGKGGRQDIDGEDGTDNTGGGGGGSGRTGGDGGSGIVVIRYVT